MANSRSWLHFGIGNLLLTMALIAIGLGWWRDRSRLNSQIELQQLRVEALQRKIEEYEYVPRGGGFGGMGGASKGASGKVTPRFWSKNFASATEIVDAVEAASEADTDSLMASVLRSEHRSAAIPRLVSLFERNDPMVRRHAALILAQLQPTELSISTLIERLDDKDDVVQRHAITGLGNFRAKSAVPELRRKMMDDDCKSAAYAAIVINALDRDVDIAPRLIALTRNAHRGNRSLAITELPSFVDAAIAEKVLNEAFAATDPKDQEMRQTIAQSINRLIITDE